MSVSAKSQPSHSTAQDGLQLKRQNTAMTIKLLKNFTKLWGISSNGVKMSVWSQPCPSRPTHTVYYREERGGGGREVPLQVFAETAN